MLSASLRLRSVVNDPSVLDPSDEYLALDNHRPPTLLVYGERLAAAILKSEAIRTYDLIGHWKTVIRGRELETPNLSALPTLEKLFEETPFFLHGSDHRSARKSLLSPYRRIEQQLGRWLPNFSKEFFSQLDLSRHHCPIEVASDYIAQAFNLMLVDDLGADCGEIPIFTRSSALFLFFPKRTGMLVYEKNLRNLALKVSEKLAAQGRQSELWALLSIMVMGQEPLFGALTYSLMRRPHHGSEWDAVTLMRESAPVSLLGRHVLENQELCGVKLFKNQSLHIAPFLVNERITRNKTQGANAVIPPSCPANLSKMARVPNSIEFGLGVHLCSGRNIALTITQAFLDGLKVADGLRFNLEHIRLYRDFNLVPQKVLASQPASV